MKIHDQTKILLVGIFSAGLFYSLLILLLGRMDIGIIIAIVIEATLLIGSMVTGPISKRDLGIISLTALVYFIISLLFGAFSEMVVIALGGLAIFAALKSEFKPRIHPTKALLVGLYSMGLLFALLVVSEGRMDAGIFAAIIIEIALLVGAIALPSVNKKELLVLVLSILVYILLALLFGVLSEIVIMAAGGIAVFAGLKSEPKFPLTKRAIGTGLIVGIIMTFFGIYIALKIGIVYFVGAELLGFLILSAFGRYTPEENTVVVAISNSSSIISVGVLIIFPAIAIFGPTVTPPIDPSLLITYEFIALVTGLSAIFGILLMLPFRDQFDEYPWPQVVPQAECINSLGGDATAKKNILTGLTAAGAWVGATKIAEEVSGASLSSVPTAIAPAFPDWIGISNSPLMAAIGFFVGWKRVIVMALGTIISISIWIIIEGAAFIPYSDHLTRPEILYLALGVFATVIIGDVMSSKDKDDDTTKLDESDDRTPIKVDTFPKFSRVKGELFSLEAFKEEIISIVKDPRDWLVTKRGKVPPWIALVSMVLFMIAGIIIFSIIAPFTDLVIPWPLFVFGAPLAVVSAYFTARAISETGMLAGYISDIVAIPAIILFHVSFQAITTFMSMLGGLQDAAIALLIHLKLGSLTGVRGRDILKAVFIGGILGTFVGSLITYLLYETYSFGGTDLPAPAAQLFGFLVVSLTGLTNFKLPGLDVFPGVHPLMAFGYLFAFGVAGFLLGRELTKKGMSAISLAVGLLVPPATTVAMLIGGFIDYRIRKKQGIDLSPDPSQPQPIDPTYDKTSRILSGIVAGETIVTVIFVLFTFFL